ncbi:hypothetical protein Tco_1137684, partial [Tanacetum coccineum]
MERAEAGTSSGSSSVLHDVNEGLKNIQVTDKVCDHEQGDDEEHEHEHQEEGFSKFVPGPLLPLKDQLDKDKVV